MRIILFFLVVNFCFSQKKDSLVYKKRVLEATEIDYLISYYKQEGVHSAVSGGIGTEKLNNVASNIIVNIPLNADDILTIDSGISAYTSASSSNINPFQSSGASGGRNGDDDDRYINQPIQPYGTPWQASSGASAKDFLSSVLLNYSHSSDSRNFNWNTDLSVSNEYDYTSIGFGGGVLFLYNDKNSEIGIKGNAYFDKWRPIYPTELHEYSRYGLNFQNFGYFNGVSVYDQNGIVSTNYNPSKFYEINNPKRNSFSFSFSFSNIINRKMQFSVFFDFLIQQGLLSTPYQRVYFSDRPNYYIGQINYLNTYQSNLNLGLFQLADDIERLPRSRIKLPIGMRLNYYVNEYLKLRSYYRYYTDDWGIIAHTLNIELPIKLNEYINFYSGFRYYIQNASNFFAPFETHVSSETYYTSDYDLSKFNSKMYSFGFTYTDIFTNFKLYKFGLKNIDFRYGHYDRSDRLISNIFSLAFKFVNQ